MKNKKFDTKPFLYNGKLIKRVADIGSRWACYRCMLDHSVDCHDVGKGCTDGKFHFEIASKLKTELIKNAVIIIAGVTIGAIISLVIFGFILK